MPAPGEAVLILGDALTELRRLPDRAFACIVTSPPYNLGHHHEGARGQKRRWQGQYPGFADKLAAGEYVSYHRAVLNEMLRVLHNDGLVWYVHRRRPEIAGRTEAALLDQVIDGYPVRSEIIWHKPGGGVFNLPHRGDGGPVCYPAVKYETVILMAKSRCASIDRGIAKLGDVWSIPRERVKEHPAAFPVALADRCIAATSAQGPVLDPFIGTGTTALAALQQGRDCTGIELVAETLHLARCRVANFQRQGSLL